MEYQINFFLQAAREILPRLSRIGKARTIMSSIRAHQGSPQTLSQLGADTRSMWHCACVRVCAREMVRDRT